ncbi:hypothetical protein Tco_0606545 [Tanacetum coccineum]
MPPRKAPRTRTTPATTTNTTSVTNAQLQAMIDQGVNYFALASTDETRGRMAMNSHNQNEYRERTEPTRSPSSRMHLPRLHEVPTSIFQRH